jgi:shikimate dehydrogenase
MTDQYAVFGNPVAHSLSPQIHAAFAHQTGQDMQYQRQLVEVDGFAQAASSFFAQGGKGLNVTVPFKLDAFSFAHQLSKRARQAGAVNTLMQQADATVFGDNTDGAGLVRDILHNLGYSFEGKKVLLLGAGGAARGVIGPLLEQQPQQLCIANRTTAKARQLAQAFGSLGSLASAGFADLDEPFDVVINATSASLSGAMPALPGNILVPGALAYDMVYGARPTPFMDWAQAQGAKLVADGLGMLVEQAAESFALWRGVVPDTGRVIGTLRQSLSQAG